jgi:peptidyl-prolyl cis-trans isomerase SurA
MYTPALILLAVTSSFSGTCWAEGKTTLDRLEASVNSSTILLSDVKKFREIVKLRTQLDPLFAGTPVATQGEKASTSDTVDFLINERIISQQFPKSDGEVEQEINMIQTNNHLDRSTLRDALAKEGYKFSDYFELIRDSGSKRDLIDRDIRTKVSISDDDIKNYFYNHYSKSTTTPRAFHIEIISVADSSFKAPTKVAAQALANKAAVQALKDVKKGESFEEVAKRVSDDASASSGGDLGTLTEDQMLPAFREQVKKLKIGEVSPIFGGGTTNGRFYILKLIDVRSNESERLDKMKEEIRTQLTAGEYSHQISLWLERQRQLAFIHRAGEPAIKIVPGVK